ncbi:MAG TPA: RDD family protein [Rubrobacteraceae bacterium]|nr:RDD family protein [Rubrobacteraceae bacterium]
MAKQSFSEGLEPSGARDVNVTGRRTGAFVIDNVVTLALILLVVAPFALLLATLDLVSYGTAFAILLGLVGTLVALALVFGVYVGYYALLEGYRGQTLGKMLTGIEVILEDTGQAPGPRAAARRACS